MRGPRQILRLLSIPFVYKQTMITSKGELVVIPGELFTLPRAFPEALFLNKGLIKIKTFGIKILM